MKIQDYKANQLCEGFVLKCGVWFLIFKADADFLVLHVDKIWLF